MWRFDELIGPLRAKLEAVSPHLNERQRRLLYGAEARQLGHGGIAAVAEAAGVSTGCVSRGLAELEEDVEPDGRIRRPGAGLRLPEYSSVVDTGGGWCTGGVERGRLGGCSGHLVSAPA